MLQATSLWLGNGYDLTCQRYADHQVKWLAKTKDGYPNLTHFICTLKLRYEIEIKSGDTKIMETSRRIYEDLITILDYTFYTYLYLSPIH